MGRIRAPDGRVFPLLASTAMGRSTLCWLHVEGPDVSRQHASILWSASAGRWELVDLRSDGGSFLNGVGVERSPITVGDAIRLAGGASWTVVSTDPPLDGAYRVGDGLHRPPDGTGCVLLEDTIVFDASDGQLVDGDDIEGVESGERVRAAGSTWVLQHSCVRRAGTTLHGAKDSWIELVVDATQEHIEVRTPGGRVPHRAQHHLLFELAGTPGEWCDQFRLQRVLDLSRTQFNLHVHRLRRALGEGAIERRVGSGQIRVAWPVRITQLD